MAPCARVRVGHARQEEDSLAEREGEKMSRFFLAILMAVLLVWSSEAKAFVPGYCPPIFCGQTPPGGSTDDLADTDTDTTNNTDEEEGCLEEASDEPRVSGHEIMSEVGGLVEVRFCVNGFVPGNVTQFRGWVPEVLLDRQYQENPPAIKNVGIYFHSDGVDGRFQTESLRLRSYIKRHQQPGELLIAISRPAGFGRTQVNHGREIEAQVVLINYVFQTFSLEDIQLYGHGVETIPIALTVNEKHPVIKGVNAFTPAYDRGRAYYYLILQRIKNLISDDVSLQIDIEHNPYDLGREGIEDFLTKIEDLGLDVETYETVDRIVSDGSISQEMLAEIEDQMLQDRAYAREHLGLVPPGITVYIGNDWKWLTNSRLEAWELSEGFRPWIEHTFSQCENVAEAGFYAIFISACHDHWDDPVHRKGIVSHEWWHTVQFYLLNFYCCTGSDRMQHVGPEWLIEGTAVAWARFVTAGVDFDLEQEMFWVREYIRNQAPKDFNLLDLNTRKGWREASNYNFRTGELAAYMLMDTAGWQSFLDFYGNLGDYYAAEAIEGGLDSTLSFGHNPELAQFSREFFDAPERLERLDEIFQAAFGRDMEEFAKEFRELLR